MGRIFGRRPDRTPAIARAVRGHLHPGEEVVAGVDVQSPGTNSAAVQGGASGGVAGATGSFAVNFSGGEKGHAKWVAEATAMGIDPKTANRTVWACAVLTTSRLILLRRSKLARRMKEPLIEWPVHDIDRIVVPRQGQRLTIHVRDKALTLELAFQQKFRPAVYDELPQRLQAVKTQARS